jgi:serine protease inhibitor
MGERTHGKIPTIIGEPDRATRLILTDASYFKGKWRRPIDRKTTLDRDFHVRGGAAVKVPMMSQSGEFLYFDDDALQAIRLPYGNGRFEMEIFLPCKSDGLPDLLRGLDLERWKQLHSKFDSLKGRLVLPRFETSFGSQLNKALAALGMAPAFDAAQANFSRIHRPPPALRINDVEHKTYVKVDEEGTEAAPATGIGMVGMAIAMPVLKSFEMIVDHSSSSRSRSSTRAQSCSRASLPIRLSIEVCAGAIKKESAG